MDGGGFGYAAFCVDAFAGLIAGWECPLSKQTACVDKAIGQAAALRARQGHPIDAAAETAEVMVRFAHDPRTRQIAMLDEDRFEVLDIAVRPESLLVGKPLAELPPTTSVISAIVRDGTVVFPRGEQELQAGDRVIVLAERWRVGDVERAL